MVELGKKKSGAAGGGMPTAQKKFYTAGDQADAETWNDDRKQRNQERNAQAGDALSQAENSAAGATGAAGGEGLGAVSAAEGGAGGDEGESLYNNGKGGAGQLMKAATPAGRMQVLMGVFRQGKQRGPLVTLLIILAVGSGVAVGSQSLAPIGIVARIKDDMNSMEVSMNKRTDSLIRRQLNRARANMEKYNIIFSGENFRPSERQKNEWAKQGITVVDNDEMLEVQVSAKEKVTVSGNEVSTNSKTKNRYMAGSAQWRGGTSGWFNSGLKNVLMRLDLTRNRWENFDTSDDAETRRSKYRTTAREKASDLDDSGGKTYGEVKADDDDEYAHECHSIGAEKCRDAIKNNDGEDKVTNRKDTASTTTALKKKATKAVGAMGSGVMSIANGVCAAYTAFETIQTLAKAQQMLEILNLATGFMEAVDKVRAGEGDASPILEYMEQLFQEFTEEDRATGKDKTTSAMQAGGMAAIFGVATEDVASRQSVMDLNSESLMKRVNVGGLNLTKTETEANSCAYTQMATASADIAITVVTGIAAVFTGGLSFVAKEVATSLLHVAAGSILELAIGALAEEAAMMIAMSFIDDILGEKLGEALVSGAHAYLGQAHQGNSGTPGSASYVSKFKEASLSMLAEKAQYERETLSPFDVTSENTFLGSIMYSMMALNMGEQNGLTSLVSKMASLVSKSTTQLLPTASAIDRTSLMNQQGDCAISETVGVYADMYCNPYEVTDMDEALLDADPMDVYEAVAAALARPIMKRREKLEFYCDYTGVYSNIKINTKDGQLPQTGLCSEYSHVGMASAQSGRYHNYSVTTHIGFGFNPIDMGYITQDENGKTVVDEEYWSKCRHYTSWDVYTNDDPPKYDHTEHRWWWAYETPTNFEYTLTDYNHDCVMDAKLDSAGNPVINPDSELGTFITICNGRTATLGLASSESSEFMVGLDLDKGERTGGSDSGILGQIPVVGDVEDVLKAASNLKYMPWISGKYCVASEMNKRWEPAIRWYQRYLEDQNWMESAGMIAESSAVAVMDAYYDKFPLDNSYEGVLARYSGMSKEEVVDTLALIDYLEWVAEYDPTGLGPRAVGVVEISVVEQVMAQAQRVVVDAWRVVGTVREEVLYGERQGRVWVG